MRGTTVDPELRRRLQEITNTYIGDRAHEQIALIEQLSAEHAHSISLVQEAISGKPETVDFTCFEYVFGLVDLPDRVRRIVVRFPHVFLGSNFASWLGNNVLEPTELRVVHRGDLVLYHENEEVKHAARLCEDLVVSKWGRGHLWRHGLLEVPESFGRDLRYFRSISGSEASDAFVTYAEQELGSRLVQSVLGQDRASNREHG
jgi:hypothetical protein